MTGFERTTAMHRLARIVERNADELARVESLNNGTLLRETQGQMDPLPSCLNCFDNVAAAGPGSSMSAAASTHSAFATLARPARVIVAVCQAL